MHSKDQEKASEREIDPKKQQKTRVGKIVLEMPRIWDEISQSHPQGDQMADEKVRGEFLLLRVNSGERVWTSMSFVSSLRAYGGQFQMST